MHRGKGSLFCGDDNTGKEETAHFIRCREVDTMPLFDNESRILQIETEKEEIFKHMENPLISQPFIEDFTRRFSWSTNAIEGNTLSLEETIAVIDYDEVRSNHTYSEYTDAKNAYYAIQKMLLPFAKTVIDEEWIKKANACIRHAQGEYRDTTVYIGNLSEAVYYPPDPQDVPGLMKNWIREINIEAVTVKEIFEKIAASHVRFERIHPFSDGNGRTGRMIINQQLINNGLLPVSIQPTGKYREAFRRYDKREDLSEMVYVLLKSELESFDRVRSLFLKLSKDREKQKKELKHSQSR